MIGLPEEMIRTKVDRLGQRLTFVQSRFVSAADQMTSLLAAFCIRALIMSQYSLAALVRVSRQMLSNGATNLFFVLPLSVIGCRAIGSSRALTDMPC